MADEEKTEKPQKQRQPRQDKGQGKGAEKGAGGGAGGGGRKGRQRGAEAQAAAVPEAPAEPEPKIPARLKIRYESEIVPTRMRVPRLDKIVINMGLGEARENAKILDSAAEELGQITGQKPVITRARKAISNFKLREGMPIGAMVTLRRERMYEFFDRLVNVALPRVRDFRGVSDKSFDGRGNYSLGLREHTIFPELNLDKVEKVKGMTISVITTAKSDFEGLTLLKALGMPFRGVGEQRAGAQAA